MSRPSNPWDNALAESFFKPLILRRRIEAMCCRAASASSAVSPASMEICFVPDQEHEEYFLPYFYVILDGTKTLEEVSELLKDTLEEHEYPVEIRVITERPYFHFKTNRKELTAQILEELKQAE